MDKSKGDGESVMKELKVLFPGGKRIDVEVDGFLIKTDQSVRGGGDASSPEPFDYFLASLAACAGIYALNFCEKRGIDTTGLGVEMRCEWNKEKRLYDRMEFILTLPDGFPEKYKDAIIRAMQLCAVKRHMEDMPDMVFSVK